MSNPAGLRLLPLGREGFDPTRQKKPQVNGVNLQLLHGGVSSYGGAWPLHGGVPPVAMPLPWKESNMENPCHV